MEKALSSGDNQNGRFESRRADRGGRIRNTCQTSRIFPESRWTLEENRDIADALNRLDILRREGAAWKSKLDA
jgi:hypothetical protein